MTQPVLDAAAIEEFEATGMVLVEDAFATGPGSVCQQWLDEAWAYMALDPARPEQWPARKYHLPGTAHMPLEAFSPRCWQAVGELVGGHQRLKQPCLVGNAFIANLGHDADQEWQPPGPRSPGWHKDGDFFLHFLDSPEQALLSIFCWTDMCHQGGATYAIADSVAGVAQHLLDHPQGCDPATSWSSIIAGCKDFRELQAPAGSVLLMHPFVLHASSSNPRRLPRFITNPAFAFAQPMCFDPPQSPIERAICRGVGAERLAFVPAASRQGIVPKNRYRMQQDDAQEFRQRADLRATTSKP